MKFNFNPLKKLVTGAAILTAGTAVAEKAPALTPESNPSHQTEVFTEAATTTENNSEVVNFNAEREMHIKKLEEQKTKLETSLQHLTAELQNYQVDFASYYQAALEFSDKKMKPKFSGLENKLADLAMKMGEEKVGKYNITSNDAVNDLLGVLLAHNGPLANESNQLTELLQGQLGSTIQIADGKPGKYTSPDMNTHKQLASDPRFIVEVSLKIVQEKHNLKGVTAELDNLLDTPEEMFAQK